MAIARSQILVRLVVTLTFFSWYHLLILASTALFDNYLCTGSHQLIPFSRFLSSYPRMCPFAQDLDHLFASISRFEILFRRS